MIQEIRNAYRRFARRYFDPESLDQLVDRVFSRLQQDDMTAEQLDDPRSYLESLIAQAADTETSLDELCYDVIRQFVFTLPHAQTVTLILHVDDGLTYRQIAAKLGIEPEEALAHLTQAYTAVRMRFGTTATLH